MSRRSRGACLDRREGVARKGFARGPRGSWAGAAVLGSGLALDWSGLTTVGTAPVILSLAPCALMCTLGLCRGKGGGGS